MSRTRTTGWHLFFQVLDVSLSVVSGLLLIPLYLQFMSSETYGAWLATGNILMWITAVDPGLTAVIEQRVASAYGGEDFQEVNNLLSAGLLITCIITLSVLGVGLAVSSTVTSLIQIAPETDPVLIESAFQLAIGGSTLMIFSYGLYGMSKGLQGTLASGIVVFVNKLAGILATVVLLYQGLGLMAIPWGRVVAGGVLAGGNAGYLIWRAMQESGITIQRVSKRKILALTRLMGYNFFGRAGNVISKNVDSFIIGRYIGSNAVTSYRLTKKAPDLVRMFTNRITVAFMPATSHVAGAGDVERARAVLVRLIQIVIWGLGLMLGGMLIFNDDFVRLWVGEELYAGTLINSLICLLLFVLIGTKSLSNLCYALGNIEGNSVASGIQSILYILISWVGAIYYDLIGLVVGAIASNVLVTLWYYPYIFAELVDIEWSDIRILLTEFGKTAVTVAVVGGLFSKFLLEGWGGFAVAVGGFVGLYSIFLGLLSSRMRTEMLNGIRYLVNLGAQWG